MITQVDEQGAHLGRNTHEEALSRSKYTSNIAAYAETDIRVTQSPCMLYVLLDQPILFM